MALGIQLFSKQATLFHAPRQGSSARCVYMPFAFFTGVRPPPTTTALVGGVAPKEIYTRIYGDLQTKREVHRVAKNEDLEYQHQAWKGRDLEHRFVILPLILPNMKLDVLVGEGGAAPRKRGRNE